MKSRKKWMVAGAALVLLLSGFVSPKATFAAKVTAESTFTDFAFNGNWGFLGDGYTVISYQDHMYVPARFVAEQMGADVSWDEATQTVRFQSGKGSTISPPATYQPAKGAITVDTRGVRFVFDGQEKKLDEGYVAISYQDHVYVPARFVAENLGALVQWSESDRLVNIVSLPESNGLAWLQAFAAKHPGELIGAVKSGIKFSSTGDAYTAVVTRKEGHVPDGVYFVKSDGSETKLQSKFETGATIQTVAQGEQTLTLISGGAGMHGMWLSAYSLGDGGKPVEVENFFGDIRADVFTLDGKLKVVVSSRDYDATGSSKEELYEYNPASHAFDKLAAYTNEYTKGAYQNPDAGAYDTLWQMRGYYAGDEGGGIPNEWNSHAAQTMNAAIPKLSWLKEPVNRSDLRVLTTVQDSTADKKTYRYTQGDHSVGITLVQVQGKGWVVDTIDPEM
ncbi:copper amine oxidase N-terminal domain-containing protein [Tumebacillus sp. ITR2]|uniref:Copper amine oxidase N-terminal domain-containing protein n=1 Tax=Tumebacillus amylolyticus TaxID=2801339 RepID=A0ABS1J926_9BACL|nr:copper amine oxidase N-terminal domain-containing protein [Tumebacillus amylolyticus]MBL0386771.1 copper amine oxidase N-terminal domain-containing protein [Tumebacillus amylolyticus]